MLTQESRRKFLKYFREHGHAVVASSPVLPHDDPTLLFINAGMNQFKDVFLGKSVREYARAATSQKCIRVGGKHNDLENVGHTRRHLTFFEMLGNFSFGDYFKKDAIRFAWEVSTQVFGFDAERIWPTVFRDDDEAFAIWKQYVPEKRISRLDEKTNFWAMGDTGPCGPCSELLYDRGPRFGEGATPKEDVGEERFLEFWNVVFMQYNRDEEGVMHPLPRPSIDTGAGLERIISLIMDVDSVYDTDVLRGLIAKVEKVTGVPYKVEDPHRAPAFRVIADHLRCLAFAIADGVQPSNVERGYVLRKVLRRAVRYGRSLGMDRPFLGEVLPALIESMGNDYPELGKNKTRIEEILFGEEEAFIRTLRRGGNILNQIIDVAQKEKRKIAGDEAFKLKDTYGFPLEEILLLAKDADLGVDTRRYTELEEEARERSRAVHKTAKQIAAENLFAPYAEKHGECEFLGYQELSAEGKVTALVAGDRFVDSLKEGMEGLVILDRTPFYAEKGGQVGDTGTLQGEGVHFEVTDCQSPYAGVIAHIGKVKKGRIALGDTLIASVEQGRRQKIANNHTATHLLHWALCKILGEHVKQAGSVVDPARLRFDFSHHKALTREELRSIEDLVNTKVRENLHVHWYELPYEEVMTRGDIKQFFGDKYGTFVRVIDIDYSKELCGGTHTSATGNIGLFRIAKEGSIAAGVRRIEAVTGEEAETIARKNEDLLNEVSLLLKTPPDRLKERIEKVLEENKGLAQEIKEAKLAQLQKKAAELAQKAELTAGISLVAAQIAAAPNELRAYADAVMETMRSGVVVLALSSEGKCQILARVSDDLVGKGIKAIDLIRHVSPVIDGGGGGKADSAQAGGKAPDKIPEALNAVKAWLDERLRGS